MSRTSGILIRYKKTVKQKDGKEKVKEQIKKAFTVI